MDEYEDKRIHKQNHRNECVSLTEQDGLAFSPFGNCSHCHDPAEGLQAWQLGL